MGGHVTPSRIQVQELYQSGIDAVVATARDFADDDWDRPACGFWTARQTATHLLGVVGWYHRWLDRAIEGAQTRPFPEAEIDERAEQDQQRFVNLAGPDAVQQFHASAADYLERTTAHWDATYPYPFGVVTTGLHCGIAATEWQLHAWDMATSASKDHTPDDPRSLLIAAGSCVAAAEGGIKGAVLRRVVAVASLRAPWRTLLQQSGRDPDAANR